MGFLLNERHVDINSTPPSPAVVVALVLCGVYPLLWVSLDVPDLAVTGWEASFACLPLAAVTLMVANLATLRARRHRAEELYRGCPLTPESRTAAHLVAVAWPAAAAALVPAVMLADHRFALHGFGRADLALLTLGPVLVAGAGVLGVLLARWVPTPAAGPLACVGLAAFELAFQAPGFTFSGWRWMAFWPPPSQLPDLVPPPPTGWHLLYVASMVGLGAIAAVARHRVRPRLVMTAIAVMAVAAVSTVGQTHPPPASAWEAADSLLSHPYDHQVCQTRRGVRYCAFARYRPLVARWAPPVDGVLGAVPTGARPRSLQVTQRVDVADVGGRSTAVLAQLARHLPDLPATGTVGADDGGLHPPLHWSRDGSSELDLALATAVRIVGLPVAPSTATEVCDSGGQSRAVVALWLAGQATATTPTALRRLAANRLLPVAHQSPQPSERRFLVVEPFTGLATTPAWGTSVGWDASDVEAALALLRRPAREVAAVVARDWDVLTDSATPSDEVAKHMGLPPGPATSITTPGRLDPFTRQSVARLRVGTACR